VPVPYESVQEDDPHPRGLATWLEQRGPPFLEVGDSIESVIGPLGNPAEVKRYGNVVFASDLVCGHAENYALCKALQKIDGNHVISIQTFPTKDDAYPTEELSKAVCDEYYLTTLDGSKGNDLLKDLLDKGKLDIVFAGGGMSALRDLAKLTEPYDVPTIVTVRQIMIDARACVARAAFYGWGDEACLYRWADV